MYHTGARAFYEFCLECAPDLRFPLSDADCALFYAWCTERVKPNTADNYRSHVAFIQELQLHIPRPVWSTLPFYSRVRKARKLDMGGIRTRKHPITWTLAGAIVYTYDLDPRSSTQLTGIIIFICILLTGVCGLFRLGELLVSSNKFHPERILRHGQISFFESAGGAPYARVWLYRSKGDTYGDGVPVYIPAHVSDPRLCPVEWLKCVKRLTYNAALPNPDMAPLFIFPNGSLVKKRNFIRWLKGKLIGLGYDPKRYAGHSLRIGGAVSAQRAGIPDHVIRTLGRWKSDAYLLYIKFSPKRVTNLRDHLQRLCTLQNPLGL